MNKMNTDYCLVSTNCIINGLNVPENMELWRTMVSGGKVTSPSNQIITEGLIRLLSGEVLDIHPEDKAMLGSNGIKIEDRDRILRLDDPDYLTHILWSPYMDQVGKQTTIRCQDGTAYPYLPVEVRPYYTPVKYFAKSAIYAYWREFIRLTRWIPNKAVVLYPTNHMHDSQMKSRLDETNAAARKLFSANGWRIYTVDNPIQGTINGVRYFGHMTLDSRQAMLTGMENNFLKYRVRRR